MSEARIYDLLVGRFDVPYRGESARLKMQMPEQLSEQTTEQKRVGNPNWRRGMSANPAGRETKAARQARLDAVVTGWAEPFGGVAALKRVELDLLYRAAALQLRRPNTAEDEVRITRAISMILKQVGLVDRRGKRRAEQQKPGAALAAHLARTTTDPPA
jgi:hypothetical protein